MSTFQASIARGLLFVSTLGFAGVASADPAPSFDLRRFSPPTDPQGTLFLEPTATPGAGNANAGAWLSYAHRPIVLRRDGEIVSAVVKDQASLDATLGLGIGKRAAIGLAIPVIIAQSTGDERPALAALGDSRIATRAVGDLALTGKANLVRMGELGGFGLATVARVTLPTGDRTSTIGEGAPTTELRLLAEMRFVAAGIQASTGFRLRTEDRTFANRTWGDESRGPSVSRCARRCSGSTAAATGRGASRRTAGSPPALRRRSRACRSRAATWARRRATGYAISRCSAAWRAA